MSGVFQKHPKCFDHFKSLLTSHGVCRSQLDPLGLNDVSTVEYSTAHNQIELISGSDAVALQFRYIVFFFDISPCLAIFKYAVHSLKPGETPSFSPGFKLCTTFLKIAKHYKTVAVRLRLIFQFTYLQYCKSVY